ADIQAADPGDLATRLVRQYVGSVLDHHVRRRRRVHRARRRGVAGDFRQYRRTVAEAGEHVGEPGLRIDVFELRGRDQRIENRGPASAFIRAGERAVAATDREGP